MRQAVAAVRVKGQRAHGSPDWDAVGLLYGAHLDSQSGAWLNLTSVSMEAPQGWIDVRPLMGSIWGLCE